MSYMEAKEDNIPIERRGNQTVYYPPCHICETPVLSWNYIRNAKYSCPNCRELLINQKMDMRLDVCMDKQEQRLKRAIDRISKQTDIQKYEYAINWIKNNLGRASWFQSTEEIMVAMELIRRKVKAHHQVRIYNYSIDFILPEYKVALEIDGKLYHGKDRKQYGSIRDEAITDKLGDGWELIRIDTENINMNVTRLLPAIKAVLKRRKKNKEDAL